MSNLLETSAAHQLASLATIWQASHTAKNPAQPHRTFYPPAIKVGLRIRAPSSHPLGSEQPACREMDAIPILGDCLPVRLDEGCWHLDRVRKTGRCRIGQTERLPGPWPMNFVDTSRR